MTPKDIIAQAIEDTHDLGVTAETYADAVIEALEKAGFVIVQRNERRDDR